MSWKNEIRKNIRGRGGKETPTHSLIATKIQDKVTFVYPHHDCDDDHCMPYPSALQVAGGIHFRDIGASYTPYKVASIQSIATTSVDSNKQVGSKSVK